MVRRFLLVGLSTAAVLTAVLAGVSPATATGAAAKAIVLTGSGSDVRTVKLTRDPVVFKFSHSGSSNFIVQMKGRGADELLANEIGAYKGETALPRVRGGRYRIGVEADGDWKLRITQPSGSGGRAIPGTFKGSGAEVLRVRVRSAPGILQASNVGDSNFIVYLIGRGSLADRSEVLLVNEIGPWSGRQLLDELPRGSYLLSVYAVGKWSLRFRR